jgi:tetratricopeptide (TPR) repeat protein
MALSPVTARRELVVLPSYEPLPPDKNPMFLEKRVYQGSSGRVYPLPFFNRIAEQPIERAWEAVTIENEFIRVVVLPELGGRIHVGEDKTNGYAFFYRQSVIKPALVGLAGPWISGGVEFNWPQHHRPATFMRVDVEIEEHADGSKTVWLGDHDPMERMKGLHGVCLHPGRAVIELKMRAYNRTPFVQSFLWWANVAVRVHEGYQSFFPPDVDYVADHAKRAVSRFPRCDGHYYGVDYGERGRRGVPAAEAPRHFVPPASRPDGHVPGVPVYPPDDLSWYANIPVPTSYMCVGSRQDFSGGYDHCRRAGLVQIADHHIAPGKKQWTWGNHDFGYAWDRNLTDRDGPYVELMLGVYTDNQPDFSFLQPGETKTWSVYWYPIREIGPVDAANLDVAVALRTGPEGIELGVAATREIADATIELRHGDQVLGRWTQALAPDRPFLQTLASRGQRSVAGCRLRVLSGGATLLEHAPQPRRDAAPPAPAAEPPAPADVPSADELYTIGLHLDQYRHATRSPVDYWREALRRDPDDGRCNNAVGLWHLRRGEYASAEACFRRAIARATSRNPNPRDGEPYYNLGLTLRYAGRTDDAYDAFYKATWNQAWQAAGFHALAEIDARRHDWANALEHLDRALRLNTDNLRARNLRVLALRATGASAAAERVLAETLALDPLDWWARALRGDALRCDTQTRLDLAIDFARAGFLPDAIRVLEEATPEPESGTAPLIQYHLAALYEDRGDARRAARAGRKAAASRPDYCFPARLEDLAVLERALARNRRDARAAYYLGNLLYDRRRHAEAVRAWERSARLDPSFPTVWRNLGIAYFNVQSRPAKARRAYERAFRANPRDPRVFYERDQLWKRLGGSTRARLREFRRHLDLVEQRDDATIELCALHNQNGDPEAASALLAARRFQPWEGGEGQALGQHVRTRLALGRAALAHSDAPRAIAEFRAALEPPENLGEARHLLANQSDVYFWLGEAHEAAGERGAARAAWRRAADFRGDFQEMSVRTHSEMTYYSARALERLGQRRAARRLLGDLDAYGRRLEGAPATIDYFATSLPTMLLFEDDLPRRQRVRAWFLRAQAAAGLGRRAEARRLLARVLAEDPSHAAAADLQAQL